MAEVGSLLYCALAVVAGGVALAGGVAGGRARLGDGAARRFRRQAALVLAVLGAVGAGAGQSRPVWLCCLVPGALWLLAHVLSRRWYVHGRHLVRREFRRGRYLAVVGLVVVVAAGWQAVLLRRQVAGGEHAEARPAAARADDEPGPELTPSKAGPVYTDRGRPISRYDIVSAAGHTRKIAQEERYVLEKCREQGPVMRTAPLDVTCNCLGWIFGDGRHPLFNDSLDMILEDNGYYPVSAPLRDDLVVYAKPGGPAVHVGVVRLVEDDLVLVESKWGLAGRFLHRIDCVPYPSAHFTFYRTSRGNHRLRETNQPTAHVAR